MKEKIEVEIRAGFISGSMMEVKIRTWPAPSILAASSSSAGRLRMNWTIRNTKNASAARNLPISSGTYVSTRPSCWNTMYCGMITTWNGRSRVAIIMPKTMLRSEEHTSELQSQSNLVCRLLLEKKKKKTKHQK